MFYTGTKKDAYNMKSTWKIEKLNLLVKIQWKCRFRHYNFIGEKFLFSKVFRKHEDRMINLTSIVQM